VRWEISIADVWVYCIRGTHLGGNTCIDAMPPGCRTSEARWRDARDSGGWSRGTTRMFYFCACSSQLAESLRGALQ